MCGWPWTADGGGPGGVALPCRAVNLRCAAARSAAPNGRRCGGRYAALGEGWVRPARTVVSVTLARATAARCRRRMSTGSNGRLRAHRSPLRVTPPQRSHSRTEILMTTTLVTSNSGTAEVQGRQGIIHHFIARICVEKPGRAADSVRPITSPGRPKVLRGGQIAAAHLIACCCSRRLLVGHRLLRPAAGRLSSPGSSRECAQGVGQAGVDVEQPAELGQLQRSGDGLTRHTSHGIKLHLCNSKLGL